MEYLFVLASFILVLGFVVIFQKAMNEVVSGESVNFAKVQSQLFMRVAILEIIPIILIIFTFSQMSGSGESIAITIPLAIIIFLLLFGIIKILFSFRDAKERMEDDHLISSVRPLLIVSLPMMAAIPIICIVFLILLQG